MRESAKLSASLMQKCGFVCVWRESAAPHRGREIFGRRGRDQSDQASGSQVCEKGRVQTRPSCCTGNPVADQSPLVAKTHPVRAPGLQARHLEAIRCRPAAPSRRLSCLLRRALKQTPCFEGIRVPACAPHALLCRPFGPFRGKSDPASGDHRMRRARTSRRSDGCRVSGSTGSAMIQTPRAGIGPGTRNSAATLTPSVSWQPVPNVPTAMNDTYRLRLPRPADGQQYFRLSLP